jgi:hypothetical protein
MFDSPSFWVAFAGLFAGTIEVSLLGRAIRILASLLGISLGEVKPKRRLWAVPLLLLHPACWALGAVVWLAYSVRAGRAPAYWGWFAGTFIAAIPLFWGLGLIALYRAKKRRSRAANV